MEEHDDSAYGGAYARHYTDEASEVDISDDVEAPLSLLLCPEDVMSVTSDTASVEEADPLVVFPLQSCIGFNPEFGF